MSTPDRINKLKEAMQGMASSPSDAAPTMEPKQKPESATRAPSRRGKRNVSAYVSAEAARQLRILVAEQETTTQSVIEEALNDLFRKYDKSAVA